ncbi:cytochrome c-type biogenesis protein CcmE [Methanohalophilus levihalophilus]|uniref:cytochrome c maturation protein CcmE domain-containing protein n=1 Tax=Methanohalophilus levihalophilus TaxID=1431282 RepID=UPI001AE29810|nr:cytochrome c maturation protein CcmE [Methanohalophilus levihalophilus]MBP2031048.1 cytochrome c-type biogenesis protein CcmE [Methanohalophilus levihalophilus]
MNLTKRQQKTAIALLAVAVFAVIGLWGIDAGQQYYTVTQILEEQEEYTGKNINTMGTISNNSLVLEPGKISFQLQDTENSSQIINVEYTGDLPPNLEEGKSISLSGRLDEDGTIYANQVVMGCPSKYSES